MCISIDFSRKFNVALLPEYGMPAHTGNGDEHTVELV